MSNNSQWYIKNELEPAIAYADSKEGMEWIKEHFPSLENLVYQRRDEILGYEYSINYSTTPIYIGEALKSARLLVHLYHMRFQPEIYFGVSNEEILSGLIKINILRTGIYSKADRVKEELILRKEQCPIVNPANLGDRCISKNERFDNVHKWYNIPEKLSEAINTAVYRCPFAFCWTELRRNTPCCNYKDLDLAYGFARRVEEIINGMTSEEYLDLNRNIAIFMGNGYWINKKVLIEVLSKLLYGYESEKAVLNAGIMAANMQMRIRRNFIKSVS